MIMKKYMKISIKSEEGFKLISFLSEESLANLNRIAKLFGVEYTKKRIRKPIVEEVNYKKLMEIPPGFEK